MTSLQAHTSEQQWLGLCKSLGTWQGNLAVYKPDSTLESRQPTVLFIYADSPTNPPYVIRARLHRVTSRLDAREMFMRGQDFRSMIYEPKSGAFCSGRITWGGTLEMALNWPIESPRTRVRAIIRLSAEGMHRVAVFRERKVDINPSVQYPDVENEFMESDYVAANVEMNVEQLVGKWRCDETVFKAGKSWTESRVITRTKHGNLIVEDGKRGVASADGSIVWEIDSTRTMFLRGGIAVTCTLATLGMVELAWWTGVCRLAVCRKGDTTRFRQEWRQ